MSLLTQGRFMIAVTQQSITTDLGKAEMFVLNGGRKHTREENGITAGCNFNTYLREIFSWLKFVGTFPGLEKDKIIVESVVYSKGNKWLLGKTDRYTGT